MTFKLNMDNGDRIYADLELKDIDEAIEKNKRWFSWLNHTKVQISHICSIEEVGETVEEIRRKAEPEPQTSYKKGVIS